MRKLIVLGCCGSLLAAAPLAADEAEQAFDRLYGTRVKAVVASPDPADDVALAKELLASAEQVSGADALLVVFCRQAFTLGQRDPSGYETALAALRLLAQRDPARAAKANDDAVALLRTAYARSRGDERQAWGTRLVEALTAQADALTAAGDGAAAIGLYRQAMTMARSLRLDSFDALQEKLKHATEVSQLQRRLEKLKATLEANPGDQAAANELVTAYLVKLNNPAGAALYAQFAEPQLRRKAELAAKPVDELSADDALMLGQWYESVAGPEAEHVKAALLDRAARGYRRFLFAYDKQDLTRTTAELALKRLESQLAEIQKAGSVLAELDARWAPLFASKTQLLPGLAGNPTPSRGTLKYEDGVLTLTDFASVMFPQQVQHVLVRAKVKVDGGGQANIQLRFSKDGTYIFRWLGGGTFHVFRTVRGQGTQIANVTRDIKVDEWLEWTVAALENTLIVYADGQEVLRLEDDQVPGAGAINLYVIRGTGIYRDAAFMVPNREQARKLVAAGGP
jgi:tetratricopeptide (TPR) repeat protein